MFLAEICSEDRDLFDLEGTSPPIASIDLLGDIPLEYQLLDALGGELSAGVTPVGEPLSLQRGESRWLSVASADSGSYILLVSQAAPCEDDGLEENDTPERALPLGFGASLNLRLCPNDPDWFQLPQRDAERLLLQSSTDREGIRLQIYRDEGGVLSLIEDLFLAEEAREIELDASQSYRVRYDCPRCVERTTYQVSIRRGGG